MYGVFWKIQEMCSKMGTKISKIDGEMPEIFDSKVCNPKNSVIRNWANLSHPCNLTFFWVWDFSTIMLLIWFKSTKMKVRPYFTMEKVQKLAENT